MDFSEKRLVLHALAACRQTYKQTIIMCRNTYVLVLLLHFQNKLTPEIWFRAGTAQNKKFVVVHEMSLSSQHRASRPAFHAIMRCDTMRILSGHGKTTTWKDFQENAKHLDKLGKKSLTKKTVQNAEFPKLV